MPVSYGCSYYAVPQVLAQYVCRCGRIHTQLGARQVSKLPLGWHETSDFAGQPEAECLRCHKKTVARRKRALGTARGV